jgi:EmrB/QacA subfamily drug resistance transporter
MATGDKTQAPAEQQLHNPPSAAGGAGRWGALGFIALAQLMVALDATIVNIALPSVQRALEFADAQRQWVITAYTLPFAGLLLLGGALADSIGRKRAFLIGLAGFAAASALAGASHNLGVLIGARAAQGAFGALLSPTALSLLAVLFTEPRERAKAFAIYGGIAGSGAAAGLVFGGAITQSADWRWCLYINVFIAMIAFIGGRMALGRMPGSGAKRLDVFGLALITGGLVFLVLGFADAVPYGWNSGTVFSLLGISLVLLTVFVAHEARTPSPLLPLAIVWDRNRGGACSAAALAIIGMFGIFLLLTYYFQVVLGYSPLQAGLAFLPMTAASMFGSTTLASRLLPRAAPRVILVPGLLTAACGMALLARLDLDSRYVVHILPAEILAGLGIGCAMITAFSVGTRGVDPRQAGVASATVNASQQVGASIGTALLNTVAASATAAYVLGHASDEHGSLAALVHGYAVAAQWASVILAIGAALAALLITARPSQ